MKRLMNLIVLSCRKATFLIEKSHDKPLSIFDSLQLSMHLKICDKCAGYQKQSLLIDSVLKNNSKNFSSPTSFKLSDTSKSRIQKAVDDNLKK